MIFRLSVAVLASLVAVPIAATSGAKRGARHLRTGPAPPPPTLAGELDDPLETLYRSTLRLGSGSSPSVTVRVMREQKQVKLRAVGSTLVATPRMARGDPQRVLRVPKDTWVVVTFRGHDPGDVQHFPVVADHRSGDTEAVETSVRLWQLRGEDVRVAEVGSIFGLRGRVIDNRRTLVVIDGPGDPAWAKKVSTRAEKVLGYPPNTHDELLRQPTATLLLANAEGTRLGTADSTVTFAPEAGGHIEIADVEHGVGYAWHGRQMRSYDGKTHIVIDEQGLSVVVEVEIEELLRGVVPAETYASAHADALKAQAVTARGEALAKIGTRHLAEPAVLCSEQHCQVFKGRGAAVPSTDAAVKSTAGQVLVAPDGHLVDAFYSAVCGGHTENNEVVWGQAPRSTLRGRIDFAASGEWFRFSAGIGEADLEDWLHSAPPAFCNLSSFRNASKFRWTKRISAVEMNKATALLGVGKVQHIVVKGRGVSGRVRAVEIVGTKGRVLVHRELPVRRLFGNLNSGMFIVKRELDDLGDPATFVFTGGGWGHGVGMCQIGAIGMAERGFDYKAILRYYYNGAEVTSLY